MKIIILSLSFYFLILKITFAQNPLIKQWDKRFGGSSRDRVSTIYQTSDGGFLVGGSSTSDSSGDKTQNCWGLLEDYWIVKTDSLGNKLWDKRFGGTDYDILNSIQQTSDSGYILGGHSWSGISGDKTEPNWNAVFQAPDFWVVKTDSLGIKQWDKRYGGDRWDWEGKVYQTNDGGYIIGGFTNSPISGDITQSNWDASLQTYDYWIIKVSSSGAKQWDKRFGGNDDDQLTSIQQTSDGGYILGGSSLSDSSGTKTQNTRGYYDYWIVKINGGGVQQWDKRFGGSGGDFLSSLQQTKDGGYILGGKSNSGISGDKTQPNWGTSSNTSDYWIVKTDSLGNKEWDKRFGGTGDESVFANISQTIDSGYLLGGTSYSPLSGDKTETNLGDKQTWVVKTDSLGNKQWDKTMFALYTAWDDEPGLAIQTKEGCYMMGNFILKGIGGYKTQPAWGGDDYWIIKFCNCTGSQLPNAVIGSDKTETCNNTCIKFIDYSDCSISRQWQFPGGTPAFSTDESPIVCYHDSGYYDVTLISTNLNGSDTVFQHNFIYVRKPDKPTINIIGDTLYAISTETIYQWYDSVNVVSTAQSFEVPHTGWYYLCVFDTFYCQNCSDSIFVQFLGINDPKGEQSIIIISPNPFTTTLTLIGTKEKGEAILYDVMGKETLRQKTTRGETRLNTSYLAAGFYMLKYSDGVNTANTKIVKF